MQGAVASMKTVPEITRNMSASGQYVALERRKIEARIVTYCSGRLFSVFD